MIRAFCKPLFFIFVLVFLAGCVQISPAPSQITARMLVEPEALMGRGPANFAWSPVGAQLLYTEAEDGENVVWLYDPEKDTKQIILKPSILGKNLYLDLIQWSPDASALLIPGEDGLYLLRLAGGELQLLSPDKLVATSAFSPSGSYVSFTRENDLYLLEIVGSRISRLTTNGDQDTFNGCLDWVYTEEMASRAQQPAYAWSPDSCRLLYLSLDDSSVQNHPTTNFASMPEEVSWIRFPVAGSPNPKPSLWCAHIGTEEKPQTIPLPVDTEYILPFFSWTPDSQEVWFLAENRDHSLVTLQAWNPITQSIRTVLQETDPYWINENNLAAPIFLPGGKKFLWLSERSGFMHLYLYQRNGQLVRQLTTGDWLVESAAWNLLTSNRAVQIDPSGQFAYFSSTKTSPLERQLFRLEISSGRLDQLSADPGFHAGILSANGDYLVEQFSSVDQPPLFSILQSDGTPKALLRQCAGPAFNLPKMQREFITLKADDGTELYAQLVKPENFNPSIHYPVVVHWYGGPTLQMVTNQYGSTNLFNQIERDVLYTQQGFLVWRLDNRGSSGRGHAFEIPIFKQLGPAALKDQLAGVRYLQQLPYVDPGRIGTDGKSFGGFMTLYALIHAPEIFHCGVAGSGVTDWKAYDTIYTERYMRTPSENPEGYALTELVTRADQIQASPLIVHGLVDTNVHLQHSVNFIQALEAADKPFEFLPLPNLDHHYGGDGLVACLQASVDYFVRQFSLK